jgi:LPXTG-motif cell wall-anchored protein
MLAATGTDETATLVGVGILAGVGLLLISLNRRQVVRRRRQAACDDQ